MRPVRQNTAITIVIGPILDADGVAKTDEVVSSIKIHKNGTAAAALNGSATLTHSQAGFYRLALTSSDTDTLGLSEFSLNSGTNSMPVTVIDVWTQSSWDAVHAASGGTLPVDIIKISGDSDAADNAELFFDGTGYIASNSKVGVTPDLYHADINISLDTSNDEYTVTWFKNGVALTSGITSPAIQVVKRVDGTDLVASTSMTQIGSTGSYKYDEGTNRITNGEAVLIIVSATIDASTRTFRRVASRDV